MDRVEIARSASSRTIRERPTARRPAPVAGQPRDIVGVDSCSCWLRPIHLSSRAIRFIIGRFVPPDDENRMLRFHGTHYLIRRPSRLRSLDINIGRPSTSCRIRPKLETITPTDEHVVRNHGTARLMPPSPRRIMWPAETWSACLRIPARLPADPTADRFGPSSPQAPRRLCEAGPQATERS